MTTYLLNSPVLTNYGDYSYSQLSVEQAKEILADGFESSVGHAGAAEFLSMLLEMNVPFNRSQIRMEAGDRAIVLNLGQRLPEGTMISALDMRNFDFELGLIKNSQSYLEVDSLSQVPKRHFFVSYAHDDKDKVYSIVRRLEAEGYKIWIDPQIPNGERFDNEIHQGIESAAGFLLMWTEAARNSDWVKRELTAAWQQRQINADYQIHPVCLEPVEIPELFEQNQINVATFGKEYYPKMMKQMATHRYRQFLPINEHIPLSEHSNAKSLELPSASLTRIPFIHSVYCHADLVIDSQASKLSLDEIQSNTKSHVGLLIQTLGTAEDDQPLRDAYTAWKLKYDEQDFLLIHLKGPVEAGKYKIQDQEPTGEWHDIARTAKEAILKLAQRSCRLSFFVAAPIPLGTLLGQQADRYWQIDHFHYAQRQNDSAKRYHFAWDSSELPAE
ncbi:STIV orfB116 family protein [Rubinisphaera italica]|uniref:TIR domain-containing protein n=1 Tax=Rubinisphaera italica TaxID=2527969 RepID=A0A5C5XNR2_9PLAN|nr:DUF1874 domain-containing protein [Rubinisphaera italica]TWT63725.1 hypothetical protein Pan54_44830 [Rubinisphaera italica]